VRLGSRDIDYGWIIVAAVSITETVTWGIIYYGFPVFLRPMERDLGASRVAITAAFSVGLGVAALAALPVGRWIDRHGGRALMTLGSCLATLLTFAWARVESLPALYGVWFLMGLAMVATLYEPAFAVVVSWFVRGRDRALLTVTLVAGFASTIFMPIEAWLLVRVGWRSALTILAVVLAVVTIPIHALVLRRGAAAVVTPATGGPPGPGPGMTLREAARTVVFWVLCGAFFVGNFATAAVSVHLIPYLVDGGYSPTFAAAVIGWTGAMQVPGRLLFVPISLVALSKVGDKDAGVASSLLNTGQQVGGSIGLAILGTVAWSAVANSVHSQVAAAAAAAKHATVHLSAAQQAAAQKAITDHAYSAGFSKGYLVSAGISLLALIITVIAIRVKREDLSGINPMAAPTD